MGRHKSAPVVGSRKVGNVTIEVRRYGERFGFDQPGRGKVRLTSLEAALSRAGDTALMLSRGKLELLDIKPAELAEFVAWKSSRGSAVKVGVIVEEFMATKEVDTGLNPGYVQNLGYALRSFALRFDGSLDEVTPAQIETYLVELGKGPVSRNNERAALVSLFRFAREREYLPDKTTAAEKVKRLRVIRDERHIEVYSASELRQILTIARSDYLPWLALTAFAQIRTEEISPKNSHKSPLRWSDIKWREKTIALRGATTKTGLPRNVPLHPTLALWLAPWRRAVGDVLPLPLKYQNEVTRLKTLGIKWSKNALRHTAISCRLAIIKNAAQVAEESGNSVAMIRRTYHNPRTMKEARAWYAVRPTRAANVVPMVA